MSVPEAYEDREQSLVKHFILQKYLERFAHIIGARWNTITYVDCFSGPWKSQSENYADTSFAVALSELKKARETHRELGRRLRLRCFFLEKDPTAYEQLARYAEGAREPDIEIKTLNKRLEDAINEIVAFCNDGGISNFSFIFIDPKGWTGFAMNTIQPLLRLLPSEVLINFMTSFIRRFINLEESAESFDLLFGSTTVKDIVAGLSGTEREDALVTAYMTNLKATGTYNLVASSIVLHPQEDRTHFHLIYATRADKGLEVFKEAERKAMPVMEKVRGAAQKRRREKRTMQAEFSFGDELPASAHFTTLRARYSLRAQTAVQRMLEQQRRTDYDELWRAALAFPMTWESDLKDWIVEWRAKDKLRLEGMPARAKVPRRGAGVRVVWLKDSQ